MPASGNAAAGATFREQAVRGVPWTLLSYVANRAVTVVTTFVLARILVPADFGLFALGTLMEVLVSVLSGIWLGAAMVVNPAMGERGKGTVLSMLGVASIVAAALLVAVAPLAALVFHEPRLTGIVITLSAVLLISGPEWFYLTVLQRELEFRRRFLAQGAQTVAFSAIALVLAAFGAGVWSLVLAYVGAHVVTLLALLLLAPYRVRPAFDRALARQVVLGGRGFLAQDLSKFLAENADYVAIGRVLGPSQLGFYSIAYRQAELPRYAIADPVSNVTFPAFAQMRHRGEDVRPVFLTTLRLVALATCPMGVILSAAAAPFTLTLLGDRWQPTIAPLAILGIWAVIRPLQVTAGGLLNSLNRAGIYGAVSMVSLVPLAVATFVAAHVGGIAAVAWVLLAHVCVTFAIVVYAIDRCAGVTAGAQLRALWQVLTAACLSWVVTRATAATVESAPPVVALAACVMACLAGYLTAVAVLAPGLLADAVRQAAGALRRSETDVPDGPPLVAWPGRGLPHPRLHPVVPLLLAAAAALGALGAVQPKLAFALLGGAMLVALPFVAPVAHLLLLVAVTVLVPFGVLDDASLGGGQGTPGLIASDVLLLSGLARTLLTLVVLPNRDRATRVMAVAVLAVLAVAVLQAVHGLRGGSAPSDVGFELRVLLGFGAALIAMPILADPTARRRLYQGLVAIGLALGCWGIAQWVLQLPFTAAGDAGVRAGVRFTIAGRGQLQGGLYAFPVAEVLALAALLGPRVRSPRARALLGAVLLLNGICLILTYERTFWLATLVGFLFVIVRADRGRRARAVVAALASLALLLATLAIIAPAELTTARQRLLSLRDYGTDTSVRYRLVETRHAAAAIREHPVVGSGLGAAILWGQPYEQVPPHLESFIHDGYLWLGWKLGVPGAVPLLLLLAATILRRGPPGEDTSGRAMRTGAQAALLVLLLVNFTFSFVVLGITCAIGLLVAICWAPTAAPRHPSWQAATPPQGRLHGGRTRSVPADREVVSA